MHAKSLSQLCVGWLSMLLLSACAGTDALRPNRSDDSGSHFVARLSLDPPLIKPVEIGAALPVERSPAASLSGLQALAETTARSHVRAPGAAPLAAQSSVTAAPSPSLLWFTNTGLAAVFKMSGTVWDGTYSSVLQIPSPWRMVAAADLNSDDNPDFIWENTADGSRAVTFMAGPAYAGSYAMLFVIPTEWRIVAGADMNADGHPDIIVENTTTGDHFVILMVNAVVTGSVVPMLNMPLQWQLAAAADMNRDGKPDLIWQNTSSGERMVTFMDGATYTGQSTTFASFDVAWKIAAAGDFNSDGKTDLIIQNTSNGQRQVLMMNDGAWSGTSAALPTLGVENSIVSAPLVKWPAAPANLQVNSISQTSMFPVGQPLPGYFLSTVVVTDAGGLPVQGVTVNFVVSMGGGTLSTPSTVTDVNGVAPVPVWTFGTGWGFNNQRLTISVNAPGVTGNPTTVKYGGYPGPAASISILRGNGLIGRPGRRVITQPVIQILDAYGNPARDSVFFSVSSGGGVIGKTGVQTGNSTYDGLASPEFWQLGPNPGTNTLTASVGSLPPVVVSAQAATTLPTPFDIAIKYDGTLQPEMKEVFSDVVFRWRQTITAARPAFHITVAADVCYPGSPAVDTTTTGLVVIIRVVAGAGAGSMGYCATGADGLPALGVATFGAGGIDATPSPYDFAYVIAHEFGHGLGLGGGVWGSRGLLSGGQYTGANAVAAFILSAGPEFGSAIPLQPDQSHWSASLMEGDALTVGNPDWFISDVDIGSLKDIGYSVDMSKGGRFILDPRRSLPPP